MARFATFGMGALKRRLLTFGLGTGRTPIVATPRTTGILLAVAGTSGGLVPSAPTSGALSAVPGTTGVLLEVY